MKLSARVVTCDWQVPQLDETFASFYEEKTHAQLSQQKVDVSLDDFDHIYQESERV